MGIVKDLSIWVATLLLLVTGCTESFSKDSYIQDYQAWVTHLEQHNENFSDEDWFRAEAEFKLYSRTEYARFKGDLTIEERQLIDRLAGKYYAMQAKYKARQVQEAMNSFMNIAKGMLEEFHKE